MTALIVGAQAPKVDRSEADQLTARIVVDLVERLHLNKPEVNDKVAKEWVENFLEALDPYKYVFLKADVEEFRRQADTLDDKVKQGDVSFARTVFDRFLQRSDARLKKALEYLEKLPDFTVDESIVDDPDLLDYPKDEAEANERLRKQIKYDLLRLKVAKIKEEDLLNRVRIRYRDLNRNYHNFNSQDLLELYLSALTTTIDPHTVYMQPTTVEDQIDQPLMHLSLEGIGASLLSEDGYPVVKEIVPGGAADKDGRLKPEDKIVGIETEDGQKEDFVGKKLTDVVRKIRGPAGSKVRLLVQPAESKELKVYELTRQKIDLKEAHAKSQVIETKGLDGKVIKVGVISLPSFYGDSLRVADNDPDAVSATQDCRKLLDQFKKDGVDVVLMDLRMNGGGLLSEAISLSGLFIDQGPVVQIRKSGADDVEQVDDEEAGTAWDGPLVVLTDHLSASASEIFAGVIQDYGRGLVIGDSSTYGKGTVQSVVRLDEILPRLRLGRNHPKIGALKLTVQQFYRANGESTQIHGVKPDIHIPSILDHQEIGEEKNDAALKFDKVPPRPHVRYGRVSDQLIATLQKRSDQRRAEHPKFREQQEAIQRYLARKARHEIPLNEEKFRAEMAATEEDHEEASKKSDEPPKDPTRPRSRFSERKAWEPGFYNDEVMAIVADYVTLGGDLLTAGPVPHGERNGRP